MKSIQKLKTASVITVTSADDLIVYLLMVQMIVAQMTGRHCFEGMVDTIGKPHTIFIGLKKFNF